VLTISAARPGSKLATMLADTGIQVVPIEGDEGPSDRYVLSKRLAIERRTGSSLLRGIMDKSLFVNAIYLREHFKIPVLVIEGQVDYTYTSFDPQAVTGAWSAMILEYGLSVVSTPNTEETARLIAMMARHEQAGIPGISLVPKRKAVGLADLQCRVVEMLPGCGKVMARDLLQHFGTVKRIAGASEEELHQVPGIGARKASEMLKVLSAEYEAVDAEKHLEDAIQASPKLLFEHSVSLLARQHCVYVDRGERHTVDMVFLEPTANELILVELKRDKLKRDHVLQIRRYLDNAHKSRLLRAYLDKGATLHGVLASLEASDLEPRDPDVSVHVVDREAAIKVLKRLRRRRLRPSRAHIG